MSQPDPVRPTTRAIRPGRRRLLPTWRRDSLRTTLWLVPAILVVGVIVLFLATYAIDRAAERGGIGVPSWVEAAASPDAGRQILIAIAAAVITVIGVVFSVTILALTLASQQFGPRMLRNFVRDLGTQLTLGFFVATFVYAILALASIRTDVRPPRHDHDRAGAGPGRSPRADLLHPPHRQIDPAPGGDRIDRPRSQRGDRRRVSRCWRRDRSTVVPPSGTSLRSCSRASMRKGFRSQPRRAGTCSSSGGTSSWRSPRTPTA